LGPLRLSQSVKSTIPKNVFQELRGRYGNVYYLRESGAEAAAVQVLCKPSLKALDPLNRLMARVC
jgi:hypothetical protein